ncbi:MAG: hypothetical protein GTO14_24060 [Anaerolineales bacterium]|nr:hypothetical protein [Anaerolineales bacterium]
MSSKKDRLFQIIRETADRCPDCGHRPLKLEEDICDGLSVIRCSFRGCHWRFSMAHEFLVHICNQRDWEQLFRDMLAVELERAWQVSTEDHED